MVSEAKGEGHEIVVRSKYSHALAAITHCGDTFLIACLSHDISVRALDQYTRGM